MNLKPGSIRTIYLFGLSYKDMLLSWKNNAFDSRGKENQDPIIKFVNKYFNGG